MVGYYTIYIHVCGFGEQNHTDGVQTKLLYILLYMDVHLLIFGPLLGDGPKEGNSASPERVSLCNYAGDCMSVYM